MRKADDLLHTIKEHFIFMGLPLVAASLENLVHSSDFYDLDHLTVIERMIEEQYNDKTAKRFRTHINDSNLKGAPQELDKCVDSSEREYLPTSIVETLSSFDFIEEGLNVCILGPSDSGKSYLAKALGIEACVKYKVGYYHCEQFLEGMASLKQKDYESFKKKMKKCVNKELLILDDFLLHTLTDEREIKVLFELLETRNELSRSTIICSQRDPNSWKAMILNDAVSANSIVKRAIKHYTVVINPKEA